MTYNGKIFGLRAWLLEKPEGSEVPRKQLIAQGASEADILRLKRWGLIVPLRHGVYKRTPEDTPQPKREPKPGEAKWRKRAAKTRRQNKLDTQERVWLMYSEWFRTTQPRGRQLELRELKAMKFDYTLIQRLVRNGFIKPVRKNVYEVL